MTTMPIIETQLKDPGGSVRAVGSVPLVQGVSAVAESAAGRESAENGDSHQHDQAASAAEIARAYTQILRIFSEFSSATDGVNSAVAAQSQMTALLPPSVVDIPVPPASSDMVQYAVHSARQIAAQAALARAAQANVGPGTVDQILAMAS